MKRLIKEVGLIAMCVCISVSPISVLATEGEADGVDVTSVDGVRVESGSISDLVGTRATVSGQWLQGTNGRWWYRHSDGTYTRGNWENVSGKWYLFDAEGWMLFGWQQMGGKWYYLGEANDGSMKSGWQKIGSNWYYLGGADDGSMKSGWQKIGSNWYYLGSADDGAMKSGWKKLGDKWYYLGSADDGAMKSGWQKLGNTWYYLGSADDGSMKSEWQMIGGNWYYLGEAEDGSMKSGWKQILGKWYYLGGADDGSMKSGWQKIGSSWYYLGDAGDGVMRESCWVGEYYVGEDGAWIPEYSETKEVKKVTVRYQYGSVEEDYEKIEGTGQDVVRKVTDYIRGLEKVQSTEGVQEMVGGGFSIRLDFVDGTYQDYGFSCADTQGNPVALSNGRGYYYSTEDLHKLWESLGGEIRE